MPFIQDSVHEVEKPQGSKLASEASFVSKVLFQDAPSIVDLLSAAAEGENGVTIYARDGAGLKTSRILYRELLTNAEQDARKLRSLPGRTDGQVVLLHFATHAENIRWFWAVTLAGFLPCISTPFTSDLQKRQRHIEHLQSLLETPIILTSRTSVSEFMDLPGLKLQLVEDLNAAVETKIMDRVKYPADDFAALMLTSGSTGNSKAVCLTHTQIIHACLARWRRTLASGQEDVYLNWVGLDHVANFTFLHIQAIFAGSEQVHIQAADVLTDPILFLRAINKHRASISFAPNFFLNLVQTRISALDPKLENPEKLDLSCFRVLYSGGEANQTKTATDLTESLKAYGVKAQFLQPGFGMTETTAGITAAADVPAYDAKRQNEFTSIGSPDPGTSVRVVTTAGSEAEANETGDLQIKGLSVFREYYNNPEATKESFTEDGWFITGDRAFIDDNGYLYMVGRSKEVLNINGVKYAPSDIESAIENANIDGLVAQNTLVFSFRPSGASTESYCVVYRLKNDDATGEERALVEDMINRLSNAAVNVKPGKVIPLPYRFFDKSSIGKLSRAKFRKMFENGEFEQEDEQNQALIREDRASKRVEPANDTESGVRKAVAEHLGLDTSELSMTDDIFDLGFSSIDIFAFCPGLNNYVESSIKVEPTDVLQHPTISGISGLFRVVENPDEAYDPVVPLQRTGDKSPLWLIHPGSGNVWAFTPLSKFFHDRPVFGLQVRGLKTGETVPTSTTEMVQLYHKAIKQTQPEGPYLLLGYSLGSALAYEITKMLEKDGDEVPFCGIGDLSLQSPDEMFGRGMLTWSANTMLYCILFDIIPRETERTILHQYWDESPETTLDFILENADQTRLAELQFDRETLKKTGDIWAQIYRAGRQFRAEGAVKNADVFAANPLMIGDQPLWTQDKVKEWERFVSGEMRFHTVDGDHANMLSEEHTYSFQRTLKAALAARGL